MDTIDTYEIKYGDWDKPRAVKVKRKGESRKEIKQKEINILQKK